jgi:deoxyribose-phosphate aldolase
MNLQINSYLELTLEIAAPTRFAIENLCERAVRERVRSIAVPSGLILLAQHFLEEAAVKISCRTGYPYGAMDSDVKRYETELAIDAGAHEIEVVPSLAKIADGDYSAVLREIRDVVEAADERVVKVAIQPVRWQDDVLREVVQVVLDSGAQYVCASAVDQIRLLREWCGPKFGILGVVNSVESANAAIETGANIVALGID